MANYRGITLISIAAEFRSKVLLNRIRNPINKILGRIGQDLDQVEAAHSRNTFYGALCREP